MSKISIRYPIAGGFVTFDCEQLGIIYLDERYKRQDLWIADRIPDTITTGCDLLLWKAIQAGDGEEAADACKILQGVSTQLGDDALDILADDLSIAQENGVFGFVQRPDLEPFIDGTKCLTRLGAALIVGDVGIIKDKDQILVCRITDSAVCNHQTWTPTDEETRFLDECSANPQERVSFGRYVVENGSLHMALFAALGDY